eukprot:3427034-Amphidinium_carterae.1
MIQAILWLEDFFNRYTARMTVKVMQLEPKEVLAFVYGIVKHSFVQDIEMNMGWIEMKNKFQVTHKAFGEPFAHKSLEALLRLYLRELIVKLRMRRSNARVDNTLGVTSQSNSRPGARSLEADANEARTPPKKKATTPPKRKLCSSYASAKGCAQGELCPLFDKGGHPRMHNKCLRCGSEEHLVKSCTRATKKKYARALQADETPEDPEQDEPEEEDEEGEAQDKTE